MEMEKAIQQVAVALLYVLLFSSDKLHAIAFAPLLIEFIYVTDG